MTVHSALGNGFQEVIYQRALEIEMTLEKIPFSREQNSRTGKIFSGLIKRLRNLNKMTEFQREPWVISLRNINYPSIYQKILIILRKFSRNE